MEIFVNGKAKTTEACSISELLGQEGYQSEHVVVELNKQIVPRAEYAATALQSGDKLEILTFVGGG